jgi:hypothetical protein|tara:strand:+ start:1891 stop:2115 length:225 start_codon:yes stop_codon:yes gene_type:complete
MNKIFEKIIEAENIVNDLYLDVNVGAEYCAFNKKEILDQLTEIEKEIAKIISLNKMNYKEFWADQKKAKKMLTQ